jgi:hypothetical protein
MEHTCHGRVAGCHRNHLHFIWPHRIKLLYCGYEALRERYGLPPLPPVSPEEAEIPPSLRGITTTAAANDTESGNATAAAAAAATTTSTNATAPNNQTEAATAGNATNTTTTASSNATGAGNN